MQNVSRLRLEWRRREGGVGRTQRDFLDFVVDDQSLSQVVGGDQVSCLGWFAPVENAKAVRRLLLEEPADLPDNRRTLYVCPECGDVGCGAISLIVEHTSSTITWRDFGYENNYDDAVDTDGYESLGPFVFDRIEYGAALGKALSAPADN